MTARNTVLLIVKQNPGIDYNSLLGKFSPNYSNINSARAALSRTLKDLSIFGFVQRQHKNFFITDKAQALLNSEMKNKLVLKLNQSIKSSRHENIDVVVEGLSTLIERSKHDENLLKAAKTSSDFFINDLEEIANTAQKKAVQLAYLEKVLRDQIALLKEMNFNDVKKTSFDKAKETIFSLVKENNFEEVVAEVYPENLKTLLSETLQVKFKDHSTTVRKDAMQDFFSVLSKQAFSSHEVVVFIPPIKVKLGFPDSYFVGPFSSISSI